MTRAPIVTLAFAFVLAFAFAFALASCAQPAPPPPARIADVIANLGAIAAHRASPAACEHREPRERDPKHPRAADLSFGTLSIRSLRRSRCARFSNLRLHR